MLAKDAQRLLIQELEPWHRLKARILLTVPMPVIIISCCPGKEFSLNDVTSIPSASKEVNDLLDAIDEAMEEITRSVISQITGS